MLMNTLKLLAQLELTYLGGKLNYIMAMMMNYMALKAYQAYWKMNLGAMVL